MLSARIWRSSRCGFRIMQIAKCSDRLLQGPRIQGRIRCESEAVGTVVILKQIIRIIVFLLSHELAQCRASRLIADMSQRDDRTVTLDAIHARQALNQILLNRLPRVRLEPLAPRIGLASSFADLCEGLKRFGMPSQVLQRDGCGLRHHRVSIPQRDEQVWHAIARTTGSQRHRRGNSHLTIAIPEPFGQCRRGLAVTKQTQALSGRDLHADIVAHKLFDELQPPPVCREQANQRSWKTDSAKPFPETARTAGPSCR